MNPCTGGHALTNASTSAAQTSYAARCSPGLVSSEGGASEPRASVSRRLPPMPHPPPRAMPPQPRSITQNSPAKPAIQTQFCHSMSSIPRGGLFRLITSSRPPQLGHSRTPPAQRVDQAYHSRGEPGRFRYVTNDLSGLPLGDTRPQHCPDASPTGAGRIWFFLHDAAALVHGYVQLTTALLVAPRLQDAAPQRIVLIGWDPVSAAAAAAEPGARKLGSITTVPFARSRYPLPNPAASRC